MTRRQQDQRVHCQKNAWIKDDGLQEKICGFSFALSSLDPWDLRFVKLFVAAAHLMKLQGEETVVLLEERLVFFSSPTSPSARGTVQEDFQQKERHDNYAVHS